MFFNATKTFTYIPDDFPASPPPPPPPSPPPSPPPVPLGCTAEDFYKYGGCASAKQQKSKGRRLLRDLKYSASDADGIVEDDGALRDSSEKLYSGYDVEYKVKNSVKKEITYVPERKIRGKKYSDWWCVNHAIPKRASVWLSVLKKIPDVGSLLSRL